MTDDAGKREAEQGIRALLDSYFNAIRSNDVDRITAHYAPDIVAYDAIGQLEFAGFDAYAEHWKACMELCQHMVFEPREPRIFASGDTGFAHCVVRCGGTGPDGKEGSGWVRVTLAAARRNGRWQIVHDHYSVPFDHESGKALLELSP